MAMTKLAPREKRLIGLMLAVMIGLTVILLHKNVSNRLSRSEAVLTEAQENLQAARLFSDTIISGREGQKIIEAKMKGRPRNFDLYAFSTTCINEGKLQDRATLQSASMSSNDKAFDGVQITLKNISVQELVDLIHKMYSSNNLIMMRKMAYLRPSKDGKGLECSLEMHSPKR